MQEISFFENSKVIVTQTRFIVAHKVVEIKNISYVKIGTLKNYMALKLIIIILGFLMMFFQELRIIGIVIFAISFLSACFTTDRFSVRISTNSGEMDTLISKDRDYIEKVAQAINSAMWAYYLKSAPM
jgi:Family of unknown function (DUF6232)